MVAFSRMVVDYVENDFDARTVKRLHHRLELPDVLCPIGRGGIANIGSEKSDGVIAPIIGEAAIDQVFVPDEMVDGQQFDGRHAQLLQMFDHGRRRESRIGAAQVVGNVGVPGGQALHVHFINHCPIPRRPQQLVSAPGERLIDHDTFRVSRRRYPVRLARDRRRVADAIAEHRIGPMDGAVNRLSIGIDQELGRIEAMAGFRLVRPMDAIAIVLSGPDLRQIHMPDVIGAFLEPDPVRLFGRVRIIEQTQFHAVAFSENSAKFTPSPSHVAPKG